MMTVAAARALNDDDVCFVGIGLPSAACNLARLTHAPRVRLVYESGTIETRPTVLPLSIGDGELCDTALTTVSVPEMFQYWLQGGRITIGFLSGAQVDRFGNLNTTVIGPYDRPTTRLPGSGGACEIAINAGEIFVIMRQSRRSFVERLDFQTSPGNLAARHDADGPMRRPGRGPTVVVTDLAVFRFDADGEMTVETLHPGVTADQLRAAMAWEPRWASSVGATEPPSAEELRLIREELDPAGVSSR
jgi:glutaconate CoA-transferase subunit B